MSMARTKPARTQVGPGTLVTLSFEVFDADGELVDGSAPEAPLAIVFGYGELLPAVEQAIQGLGRGAQQNVVLRPEQGYGRRDPKAVLELDRDEFPADVAPGDRFEFENQEGGVLVLRVLDVDESRVVLDLNHPLSGQKLRACLVIEDVRPATAEELSLAEARLLRQKAGSGPPPGPSASLGSAPPALLPVERLLKGRSRRYEKPARSKSDARRPVRAGPHQKQNSDGGAG